MLDLFDGLDADAPVSFAPTSGATWLKPIQTPTATVAPRPASGGSALSTAGSVLDLLTKTARDVDQYLLTRKQPQPPVMPSYAPAPRSNTLYYVIGGIAVAGLAYYIMKKRKK